MTPAQVRHAGLGIAAVFALAPNVAMAADAAVTVVQPAAGFLVTDGQSIVPLQIIVRAPRGPIDISRAVVRASLGQVTRTRVVAPGRVSFLYTPPRQSRPASEMLDLELTLSNGDVRREAFPIEIPTPIEPSLQLLVDPSTLDATQPRPVAISAGAFGAMSHALELHSSHGDVVMSPSSRGQRNELHRGATMTPPANTPNDAPSHFIVVGVASGPTGFAAGAQGVSVVAPIRIRAEIRRGSRLVLEGAEADPEPVKAPADGFTTIYGVVRYGAAIRAYSVRGRKRTEVPIVVPSGLVSPGLAIAIPGQDIADGGTGASILVAVPPSPFGEEIFWPTIELEGASLVDTIEVADGLRALIIQRPTQRTMVSVLADGIPIGALEFGAGHGTSLDLNTELARSGERAAVIVTVKDPLGTLTDRPVPKVRLSSGGELQGKRVSPGRFRFSVPTATPGPPDSGVMVTAELAPPRIIAGDAPELVSARREVTLEGPPPAIKPAREEIVDKVVEAPPEDGPGVRFGLSAQLLGGATAGAHLVLGGGVNGELRLPVWDHRIGVRTGVEYFRTSSAGKVTYAGGTTLDSNATVAGILIPFEVGAAIVDTDPFDLVVRGGLALRFENGVVDIDQQRIGGGKSFGVGFRGTVEANVRVSDSGEFTAGATVDGLGASASGLSSPDVSLEGSLMQFRLDLGFRFWL